MVEFINFREIVAALIGVIIGRMLFYFKNKKTDERVKQGKDDQNG